MIIFPNIEDYITDHKNNDNIITIKIQDIFETNIQYFNVNIPFPCDIFIKILQELVNQMKLNLKIEQVTYNSYTQQITMWQLVWFIKNIKRNRIANITIHRKDNSDIDYKIDVDDMQYMHKLIRIIKDNAY